MSEIARLDLSVVVPSVNGWSDLGGCLDALDVQRSEVSLEVLVPERCGDDVRRRIAERHPWVRVLPADAHVTIPDLRAMAFSAARADSVAVIEDHVVVPPGWARQLVAAQRRGEDVVGGSVYNAAVERTVDWAAFLCEYSHLLPPLQEGPAEWLTGNNTVYRRDLLHRHRDATTAGRWENHLHDVLRAAGVTLHSRPEIVVAHKKHYTVREYTTQRFLYARSYAGARVQGMPASRRVVYVLGAFVLPPVLFLRVVSRVLSKRKHRAELARSLPLLAWFVCAWACGEAVGYAVGPGNALSKVC